MFVSNATMLLKLKAWVIVIINKEDKSCFIVDIAIPGDSRPSEKGEKVDWLYDYSPVQITIDNKSGVFMMFWEIIKPE